MSARFVVSKTDGGIPETIQENAEDTENVEIIVEDNKELGMNVCYPAAKGEIWSLHFEIMYNLSIKRPCLQVHDGGIQTQNPLSFTELKYIV